MKILCKQEGESTCHIIHVTGPHVNKIFIFMSLCRPILLAWYNYYIPIIIPASNAKLRLHFTSTSCKAINHPIFLKLNSNISSIRFQMTKDIYHHSSSHISNICSTLFKVDNAFAFTNTYDFFTSFFREPC